MRSIQVEVAYAVLFIYQQYMPLRWLEEIYFWKTQEKEHTVVIREIVPGLEPQYIKLMQDWEPVFEHAEQSAKALIDRLVPLAEAIPPQTAEQVNGLLQASAQQSRNFIGQLGMMLQQSAAVQASPVAQTVILHIMRESDYFLCVIGSRSEEDETGTRSLAGAVPIGGHTLPPLPYPYNALEPYIDEATMRIHHDKHHKSYVEGLNKAEKELEKARKTGDFDLVKHWERELAFNGAGHYLHTLFWNVMSPHGGGTPSGPIANQIVSDFGSYEAFKKHFSQAAEKVEGGGWAILVWSPRSRRLEILQAEKHQNLSQWDVVPVLPLDVWEHAYYLKHQNKRADYIKDWWNVVNWPYVNERFLEASKLKWTPY
ncbi:Fe-Mn family superoxide dismutase [Paenibacillus tarimensis]